MIKLYDARITDGLPQILTVQPWAQALAFATRNQIRKVLFFADKTRAFSDIDELDEDILDALAVELRTPKYSETFPIEVKRKVIKNSLVYFTRAGTKASVVDLIQDIYGGAYVEEWFDYGGAPGHFRIVLDITKQQTTVPVFTTAQMDDMLASVKRYSAHLDGVFFMVRHPIEVDHRCEAFTESPPLCGTIYCGTYWTDATKGQQVENTLLIGGVPDAYTNDPPLAGTVPDVATVGSSYNVAVDATPSMRAHAITIAEAGAESSVTGTIPTTATIGSSITTGATLAKGVEVYATTQAECGTRYCGADL